MKILITTATCPFVYGGAEIHAEQLLHALRKEGHEAELISIPFKWYPPEKILDQMLACRLLDLTEANGMKVDRLIGLKFPAYLVPHPNKVLWVLHQHRPAYDMWDHPLDDMIQQPNGSKVRDAIRRADDQFIPEAKRIYANSANVAARLKRYNGIDSTPLYHPPLNAEQFYCDEARDYIYYPSRITPNKRQPLVIEALAYTNHPVRVKFAGTASYPPYMDEMKELAERHGVEGRIEWLGHVTEEEKRFHYAHSLGVVYPPVDEDYGYITLEAMLSSKPVITCTDSGGPLEFVGARENGLVAEPTPVSLAAALDEMWDDRERAGRWGAYGREVYESHGITWPKVVERLLA